MTISHHRGLLQQQPGLVCPAACQRLCRTGAQVPVAALSVLLWQGVSRALHSLLCL